MALSPAQVLLRRSRSIKGSCAGWPPPGLLCWGMRLKGGGERSLAPCALLLTQAAEGSLSEQCLRKTFWLTSHGAFLMPLPRPL